LLLVDAVEILSDNTMRWHIAFWNRGNQEVDVFLDYRNSYIVDEFGNKYIITAYSNSTEISGSYQVTIPQGVRLDQYIDFSAIKDDAKTFSFGFVSNNCCSPSFDVFIISLPS
jgi:hypothetical protein